MPLLREKLADIDATLRADTARGRLALGALLRERRLRVYSDGRVEGIATLGPETLAAPRKASERQDSVVAGAGNARGSAPVWRLPVPLGLPVSDLAA